MAIPQYAQIDLNRLQAIIEKFQYAVTDASKTIKTFSNKQEGRFQTSLITALNEKLKNPTVIIQDMQSAGIQDGQRYLETQRAYNQLLQDQKNAFTSMTSALQNLSSKVEQQNPFTKNQNDKDTANALGVTVFELMFNRFMAHHNDINDGRADANLEIVKAISDKRKDPEALKQDELVGSLANVKGNENLIQNLQNAKGLYEVLLILMQAGSVAEKMKNQNALDHISKAFGGDEKSRGMFITPTQVPTADQKFKLGTSEGTNVTNIVAIEKGNAEDIAMIDKSTNIQYAYHAQVTAGNREEVNQAQAAAKRGKGYGDQLNVLTEKMINNPGYTALVTAGLQYAKQVESVMGSMGGLGGATSDLGGALMGLVGKFKKANLYITAGGEIVKAGTIGALGYQQLSGTNDDIRPKPTAEERDKDYKVAADELNNEKNKQSINYLKEKMGLTVQYNKEMLRFDVVDKKGEVVGNLGRRLETLTQSITVLTDPAYQAKRKTLEERTGGQVQFDQKTGKNGLYIGGKFVDYVDLTSWRSADMIRSDLNSKERAVYRQLAQEKDVDQHNTSAKGSASTIDDLNKQNALKQEPKTTTLPSLPTTNQKPPSQEDVRKFQEKNSVGRKSSTPVNAQQHNAGKRTTAHDLQMAKECSRIENTCNNYHNDIKVIVNPSSGDPIQIANQVCEQLKRHSCGQSNGMSKQAIQNKKTGH